MLIGVLGEMIIRDDADRELPVRSGRQWTMLAMLVCERGVGVPVDRLCDALWVGVRPPAGARRDIATFVHRLRGVLGKQRIRHSGSAYELVVRPDDVDAWRFEALAAEGHAALAAGDAEEASGRLGEALALWRGTAFAGFEGIDSLKQEATRLEELRTVATEARIDADLVLGRHQELVPELSLLAERFPLRERFRAQLMLALYRSSQIPAALEVYRETRALLVEELGLEPSAELRQLERSILDQDPRLAVSAPTGSGAPKAAPAKVLVPAELPPSNPAFTGRTEQVGQMVEALADGSHPVIALSGPGGIGKSALAIATAHAVKDAFPDGQLYVNLRGGALGEEAPAPRIVLGRFLRSFGLVNTEIPDEEDEAAARYRSLTADLRLLVVLDDAVNAAQVRPLLPAGSGCAVLVTSRPMLSGLDTAGQIPVDALSNDEAIVLLARLSDAERVAAAPDAAAEIVELCDRLPLAVRIAAARLTARPDRSLSSFAGRLRGAQGRLDELEHADLAVRASISVSVHGLPDSARRLLWLLALPDLQDLERFAIDALDGRPASQVRRDVDRLIDAQLLNAESADRYSLHDLVRLYGREQTEAALPASERTEALRRLVHSFVDTARQAMRTMRDPQGQTHEGIPDDQLVHRGRHFDGIESAVSWVRAAIVNIAAVAVHADSLPDGVQPLLGLAFALTIPLHHQSLHAETVPLLELTLRRSGDHPDLRHRLRRNLAEAYIGLGRLEDAEQTLTTALAELRDDDPEAANLLNELGRIRRRQRDHPAAIEFCRRALPLARISGNRFIEARVLNTLACLYHDRGQLAPAIDLWEEAGRIHREIGGRGLGVVLGNLGEAYAETGDPATAAEYFRQAIPELRALGFSRDESERLWDLGEALYRLGRPDEARVLWREAAELGHTLGHVTREQVDHLIDNPHRRNPFRSGL